MAKSNAVDRVRRFLIAAAAEIAQVDPAELRGDSPLTGAESCLSSRDLVELLLAVEDFAESELGASFSWNSPETLANQRSIFRNVDSLAAHVATLPPRTGADH